MIKCNHICSSCINTGCLCNAWCHVILCTMWQRTVSEMFCARGHTSSLQKSCTCPICMHELYSTLMLTNHTCLSERWRQLSCTTVWASTAAFTPSITSMTWISLDWACKVRLRGWAPTVGDSLRSGIGAVCNNSLRKRVLLCIARRSQRRWWWRREYQSRQQRSNEH